MFENFRHDRDVKARIGERQAISGRIDHLGVKSLGATARH
jgi:hypothetical protein